jgi:hypothetical protein
VEGRLSHSALGWVLVVVALNKHQSYVCIVSVDHPYPFQLLDLVLWLFALSSFLNFLSFQIE